MQLKTILPFALLFALSASLAHAQSVWVAPETQKVRPTDVAVARTSISLEAARNEFEAFQVIVDGGEVGATAVTVAAGELHGPGGATIGGGDVRVFREAFIDVVTRSNVSGAIGRWPDALIPAVDELYDEPRNAFPISVPAREQQAIYVEYRVPPAVPPGVYSGSVHVAGAGLSVDVPVTLAVHALTLPSTASLRTAFGIGWDDPCIAHYGGYTACGGDAGAEAMRLLYVRFALDHRFTLDSNVYDGPAPLGSDYDWATWDQRYSPTLDGHAQTRLAGARVTSVRYVWKPDRAHYQAWAAHARQRGWLDRTFDYTCDEPPNGCQFTDIPGRIAEVHAGDPELRTLVTTTLPLATAHGLVPALDVLVPVLSDLAPRDSASTRASYDAWLGAGERQLWWYQSCMSSGCDLDSGPLTVGWPTYAIDAPAALNRAMEWQSWKNRMQGELYYDTTYAFSRGDAWTDQLYFGNNGDGTLFYPGTPAKIGGTHHIPIASLRMKLIRAGMEDYEYLKALADAGDAATADSEAAGLAPSSTGSPLDPNAIDGARHRMLARLDTLLGMPAPVPAPAPPAPNAVSDGSTAASSPAPTDLTSLPAAAVAHAGGCSFGGELSTPGLLSLGFPLALALALTLFRRRR